MEWHHVFMKDVLSRAILGDLPTKIGEAIIFVSLPDEKKFR